jgi:hypothetical protein
MKLPDGTVLMHAKRPYDPVKAREYYLRTRKLKGRKKTAAQKDPQQIKYRAALDAFLKKLPMAIEGANLKDVEQFVDSMRTKSDAELRAEAAKIRREKGDNDGAQVATINMLLENRNRVRSKKADSKKVATQNTKLKQKLTKTG